MSITLNNSVYWIFLGLTWSLKVKPKFLLIQFDKKNLIIFVSLKKIKN